MALRRTVATAAATLLLTPVSALAAFAAPPPNDNPSGATPLTMGTVTEDTSEATTDSIDAALNEQCGAPTTEGSVWFTFTDDGSGVLFDVTGSDYSAGVMVTVGDPADGNLIACGPGVVGVRNEPGTVYYVMVFGDSGAAGNLVLTTSPAPPAPEISLSVNAKGTATKDGSALISGTYSCLNSLGYNGIEGSLTQTVGRTKINGFFGVYDLICDGAPHPWEAIVTSDNGVFAGGKAANVTFGFVCGLIECASSDQSGTIQLSKAARR